VLAGIHNGVLS